jgi:hypothetical protein
MKKVTLTDMNGKEIEVYFVDSKTAKNTVHNDDYNAKIEDIPLDKNWFDMTGGGFESMNELDVNENSAWCGAGDDSCGEETKQNFYEKLNKKWADKIKGLEESQSQIKIDDTIPSDFVESGDLRNGAIYKVAGLNLVAKLVEQVNRLADTHEANFSVLLKMKSHGTVFYVEEGSLIRATNREVERYLNEPF